VPEAGGTGGEKTGAAAAVAESVVQGKKWPTGEGEPVIIIIIISYHYQ
jgi:hypothetical protein